MDRPWNVTPARLRFLAHRIATNHANEGDRSEAAGILEWLARVIENDHE
jgi:hypothetical protein